MTDIQWHKHLRSAFPGLTIPLPKDRVYGDYISLDTIWREWRRWNNGTFFRAKAPAWDENKFDCNKRAADFIVHIRRVANIAPICYIEGYGHDGEKHAEIAFFDGVTVRMFCQERGSEYNIKVTSVEGV